jgi:hypothetical protein
VAVHSLRPHPSHAKQIGLPVIGTEPSNHIFFGQELLLTEMVFPLPTAMVFALRLKESGLVLSCEAIVEPKLIFEGVKYGYRESNL